MSEIGDDEPIILAEACRGRVYFITAMASGTVKVGYSTNVRKRLIDLQTSASVQLRMEFSCVGDRELERALHAFLKPYRVSGEWFKYGPHIHDLIDEISDFLSVKADDADMEEWCVPISADDLQKIVSDPHYGMDDIQIHAMRSA
jgi:Meiotically up-regulated gene 113